MQTNATSICDLPYIPWMHQANQRVAPALLPILAMSAIKALPLFADTRVQTFLPCPALHGQRRLAERTGFAPCVARPASAEAV